MNIEKISFLNDDNNVIKITYKSKQFTLIDISNYLTKKQIDLLNKNNNIDKYVIDENFNLHFECGITFTEDILNTQLLIRPNPRLDNIKKVWGDSLSLKLYNHKSLDYFIKHTSNKKINLFVKRKKYIRVAVSCRGSFAHLYCFKLEDKKYIEKIIRESKDIDNTLAPAVKSTLKETINIERLWMTTLVPIIGISFSILISPLLGKLLSMFFVFYFILAGIAQLRPALPILDNIENVEDFLDYCNLNKK